MRHHRLPEPCGTFEWPHGRSDWTFRRLAAEPGIVEGWVSFDAVVFDPATGPAGSVWCGLNVLDPLRYGILHRFDLATCRFVRADLDAVLEPFDVKIHKGLTVAGRRLVFATASFLDAPDQAQAPGGKLIVYDTERARVESCAVPVGPGSGFPLGGQYVQSILYDTARETVYGCTYPLEVLFAFDLRSRRTRYLAHLQGTQMGQPHNLVRDGRGRIWGTYGIRNGWSYEPNLYPVRPFVLDPDTGRIDWLESCLLPRAGADDDPCNDAMAAWGEWIYVADKAANLCRVHAERHTVEYLGRTSPRGRLPSLCSVGGSLWGVTGDHGQVELIRVTDTTVETVGRVAAADGERPERLHDLTYAGEGRFFAGENDHHRRSGYLWEIRLPQRSAADRMWARPA